MLLPRSLAHIKRNISERKWVEAHQWAGGRTSKTKYRMPKTQRPDGTVSGSPKRLASRFYQLKTGRARIGQYLHWAKVRPTAQRWWCQGPTLTREHLFKVCPELITDKIHTWLLTRESVSTVFASDHPCGGSLSTEQNQSAFMIDLQQIKVVLCLANRRSLITIDEFGKGTTRHNRTGFFWFNRTRIQPI